MDKFDPKKALVILLGAEEWPKCPSLWNETYSSKNPFRKSFDGIKAYFLKKLKIAEENIQADLFNSSKSATDILNEIEAFLKNHILDVTDVFLYYVGHGTTYDNEYCLAVSNSEEKKHRTFIEIKHLFNSIEQTAPNVRCHIILDACFSGSAVHRTSSSSHSKGIGLLYSSKSGEESRILKDGTATAFTAALLEVLLTKRDKRDHSPQFLLFNDLKLLVNETMKDYHVQQKTEHLQEASFIANRDEISRLPIFRNPSYKDVGDNKMTINWHITTSSKGGVGKTLLAVFLITYCVKNRIRPLVIDFNGVNTDLKRLIRSGSNLTKQKDKHGQETILCSEIEIGPKADNKLVVVKVEQGTSSYLLGWSSDPYRTYDPVSFVTFLSTLREKLPFIEKTFGDSIDTVIIDTNYHFGNLFSKETGDYQSSIWQTDHFFIWFIWVYSQIQNCFHESQRDDLLSQQKFNEDVLLMKQIAGEFEKHTQGVSPFIHVINPQSLSESSSGLKKIWDDLVANLKEKFKDAVGQSSSPQDYHNIPELKELVLTASAKRIAFGKVVNLMVNAQKDAKEQRFSKMLEALKEVLKKELGGNRPRNFFPIYTYHKGLDDYHDRMYELSKIQEFEVYTAFESFFSVLGLD